MYNHVTVFDEIGKSAANNTHLSFEKKVHKDKNLKKKNIAQLNIKWGTNSCCKLCLVAFFIDSSHITQCMILAGKNEFINSTLLYNLYNCLKSKASKEVRSKRMLCNRNGRNLVNKLPIYERR